MLSRIQQFRGRCLVSVRGYQVFWRDCQIGIFSMREFVKQTFIMRECVKRHSRVTRESALIMARDTVGKKKIIGIP